MKDREVSTPMSPRGRRAAHGDRSTASCEISRVALVVLHASYATPKPGGRGLQRALKGANVNLWGNGGKGHGCLLG